MKKTAGRMISLLLVLAMAASSVPQSAITVNAAEIAADMDSTENAGLAPAIDGVASIDSVTSTEDASSAEEAPSAAKASTTEDAASTDSASSTEETVPSTDDMPSAADAASTEDAASPEETPSTDDASSEAPMSTEQPDAEGTQQEETETTETLTEETKETAETEGNAELEAGEVGILEKGYGLDQSGNKNSDVTWTLYENGKLVVEGEGNVSERPYQLAGIIYDTTPRYRMPWDGKTSSIKTVEFKVNGMTTLGSLFYGCTNLTDVDFSGSDLSTVTDMEHMFMYCSSLTSLDVGGWDVSGVQSMRCMFYNCSDLTALKNIGSWDTGSVTSMLYMFYGCSSLTGMDLSGWKDTGSLRSAYGMFAGCENLTDVNLSGWDTHSLVSAASMFGTCSKLTDLNLSGWNTGNVQYMSNMFYNCRSLTSLDLSRLDTGSVTTMEKMFYGCGSLTSLNVSGWNTGSVTNMENMFYGCSKLPELNLTGWNTEKLENIKGMFNYCSSLTSLDLSGLNFISLKPEHDWQHSEILLPIEMFYGCSSLTSITNPYNVECEATLPAKAGHSWRRANGTAKKVLEYGLEEGEIVTFTNDQMVGVDFLGKNYTLQDGDGNEASLNPSLTVDTDAYGEKVVEIGAKEAFTFTVVPKAGYTLKSITLTREGSTIALEQGSQPNQYTVAPADAEAGYTRDESVTIEIVPIEEFSLKIAYDDGIVEAVAVNGSAQSAAGEKPETVQTSNAYAVNLYVKIEHDSGRDPQEPWLYRLEGTNKKKIDHLDSADSMGAEERAWSEKGYFVFRLGALYEDTSISLMECFPLSADDIASGADNGVRWLIDKNGRLKIKGKGDLYSAYYVPWSSYRGQIISVVADWKGATGNFNELFLRYEKLEEADLSGLDTSGITDMSSMFYGCYSLTSVDLSGWDTSGVTDMHSMFSGCKSLTSVDLSGLDFGSVTRMPYMFNQCESLTSVDLSGLDFGSVTDMSSMFSECYSLTSVDLSGLGFGGVTDMSNMFNNCKSLTSVDLSGLDFGSVISMRNMFYACSSLTQANLSGLDISSATELDSMFYGCRNLTSADLSGVKAGSITNMEGLFCNCESLTKVNLSGLDTSSVTNMEELFCNCKSLTALDLGSFDTRNVTRMIGMFSGCENLTELNLKSFDTGNVIYMGNMFYNCKSLIKLDLSNFYISDKQGSGSYGMLDGCSGLEEIKTPQNENETFDIKLPTIDGRSWRLSDGTKVTSLPKHGKNSVTLTSTRAAVYFTGEHFTLKDSAGNAVEAGHETLVRIGEKDALAFTIEAEEGYVLKSVQPASQTPTVALESNSVKSSVMECTVLPADADAGYVRDEELRVESIPIVYSQMRLSYPYEGIADAIVVHGGSWTRQMPGSVQVSNAERTVLYVKTAQSMARFVQFPSVAVSSVDENGYWYSKTVPVQNDLPSMGEEERKLVSGGYCAFDLGVLYGNADVTVSIKTIYGLGFEMKGFPADVQVIRYLPDENGVMRGEECAGGITAERGETVYFQVKWDGGAGYGLCHAEAALPDSSGMQISSSQFSGVEGSVWGVTLYDDVTVQVSLKPHMAALSYVTSDITGLTVAAGSAKLSEDLRTLEIYGGNALSLTFGLADNITLKGVSADAADLDLSEKDGVYTVTVRDSSKIADIGQITIDTEDALGRYSLSDLECHVEYMQYAVPYTGKPVQPTVRRVTVRLPDSKKETVLKEKTDYTVSCVNNVNVGTATMIITAAENSKRYRGSFVSTFEIIKADAPFAETKRVHMDVSCAGTTQQLDLSGLFAIDTAYEKGVIPTGYQLNLSDYAFSLGDVMKGDPTLQGSVLTYSIWADADKYSAPAVVVVQASFDNYNDARLLIEIRLTRKEDLTLAGTVAAEDKVYDGMPAPLNADGLYVASVSGKKPENPKAIMDEIRGTLTFHYTGVDGTVYDSDAAPVDAGSYRIAAAVSEENMDYRSGYVDAGSFTIAKRSVELAAEDIGLYIGDSMEEEYSYQIAGEGLAADEYILEEPRIECALPGTAEAGEYPITVQAQNVRICDSFGKDTTKNYRVSGKDGVLTIAYPKVGSYTVTYSLTGHGEDIIRSGMEAGSLLARPKDPKAEGYVFLDWYKDEALSAAWDFGTDTIQDNITLYAGWSAGVSGGRGAALCIQNIADQPYTGKAIKPAVIVYAADGKTQLKAGKDYSVSYKNNIEADASVKKFGNTDMGSIPSGGFGGTENDTSGGFNKTLAYVVITGKGSYTGTACMNFHITAADISAEGFTLKYTDQFEAKAGKKAKIVSQLKYKKALKLNADYTLLVEKISEEGNTPVSLTDKGELALDTQGAYRLTVTGQGNYTGSIAKGIYIADKSKLMKNAKIAYEKTIKNVTKEQLENGVEQPNVTVKGLTPEDYVIAYENNHAAGTATMTVTGRNGYVGSKSVTFKIQGAAFKEKAFQIGSFSEELTYSGVALTQNGVTLTPASGGAALTYGKDYIIRYANNIRKGKAVMFFTAAPSSGYTGSFKKTFKITPLSLDSALIAKDGVTGEGANLKLTQSVPYRKGGAQASGQLELRLAGALLEEGRDYTVKYKDNGSVSQGKAVMAVQGKGNFDGSLTVKFDIQNASLSQLYRSGELTISVSSMAFQPGKTPSRAQEEKESFERSEHYYKPSITIKDGGKALKEGVDYEIVGYNDNEQSAIEEVDDRYNDEGKFIKRVVNVRPGINPLVEIRGINGYGGSDGEEEIIARPFGISSKNRALSAAKVRVFYDNADGSYTYTGEKIEPPFTAEFLEGKDGEGDPVWTSLTPWREGGGDYLVEYGANTAQGKGTITITGVGCYKGAVTKTFVIGRQEIYSAEDDDEAADGKE